MALISQKTLMRKGLGFLHLGRVFKLSARRRSRRDRPFFFFEGRAFTYGETLAEAERFARFFTFYRQRLVEAGKLRAEEPLSVAMYLENCPEFVFALFGAAISGSTLIGANTGFRGDTLAQVVNLAESRLLITSPSLADEVQQSLPSITTLGPDDIYLVGSSESVPVGQDQEQGLVAAAGAPERLGKVDIFTPLIVIYTSGTTGIPKGVPCPHAKLLGAGVVTKRRLKLTSDDKGYVCMPMFHSNAWYLGIMPTLIGGGSFVLKPKFSASAFEEDILEHGVTYMNYVGQPLHYILTALEKKYGSPEAVEAALARHPKNRFRTAVGNGAPPVDRKKLIRYLGMDHIFELYGSTEAPISTWLMPGDPIDSLGRLSSKKVVILNELNQVCAPAEVDDQGRITNYDQSVGEIAKVTEQDNIFFDGYFKNQEATGKKFRDGYFRSGDLGYVRVIDGKRFLYFVGRTDDWIRKDGENFSAESVLNHLLELPGAGLVATYGAPCEVSDEKVMAAIQMEKDAVFDPKAAFDWFMERQKTGGMDPKWMPDYIRIVEEFDMTPTQKILVRPLKREHFNLDHRPDMRIYFRQRGDETYRELTPEAFAEIKKQFEKTGRQNLLDAGL